MKYTMAETGLEAPAALGMRIEAAGGWWVRFGRRWLVYAANRRWPALRAELVEAGCRVPVNPAGEVRKGHMVLVTQTGRAFQQAHPGMPVLVDMGRWLVVDCPDLAAVQPDNVAECYRAEPLAENQIVFEEPEPGAQYLTAPQRGAKPAVKAPRPTDPVVMAAIQAQLRPRYTFWLQSLTALGSRHSGRREYGEALALAESALSAVGYSLETLSSSLPEGGYVTSLIASASGDGSSGGRALVQLIAHLDSINHVGGIDAPAPGADDNASGAAGVLVLAEYLAGTLIRGGAQADVQFVLSGGEEQGLLGSRDLVAALSDQDRQRLVGVINMDMIGVRNTERPGVLIEAGEPSGVVLDALVQAATRLGALQVQVSRSPFGSDHVPYIEAGLPAVLTIEASDDANAAIHTADDTVERLDLEQALSILGMNLLALQSLAGIDSEVPDPTRQVTGLSATEKSEFSLHARQLLAQYRRLAADDRLPPEHRQAGAGLSDLLDRVERAPAPDRSSAGGALA